MDDDARLGASIRRALAYEGYAVMGAMFLMPKIGTPGPTIGGPLTVTCR